MSNISLLWEQILSNKKSRVTHFVHYALFAEWGRGLKHEDASADCL